MATASSETPTDDGLHFVISIDLEANDNPEAIFAEIVRLMEQKGIGRVNMRALPAAVEWDEL